VKIAVTIKGRQRPADFSINWLSSGIDGKSTPARTGPVASSRSSFFDQAMSVLKKKCDKKRDDKPASELSNDELQARIEKLKGR
jgi:hypothetical protein